jgi:hypothetical protein
LSHTSSLLFLLIILETGSCFCSRRLDHNPPTYTS